MSSLISGPNVLGNVLIHNSASVDNSAQLGPDVSVGRNCTVRPGARLRNCVIMDGSIVGRSACVTDSIIGWASVVGDWARVAQTSVLGEDVHVKPETIQIGAVVLPHKELKADQLSPAVLL